MTDLTAQRRFFAEEIQIAANLRSPAVVEALASIPRERFLPAGPWTIRSESDLMGGPRTTVDADPRHVYHNIAIAIDASRMLFNGAPSLLSMAIDSLALAAGSRVLHLGTGTGYYTAIMARCVGPTGRVVGIEVDAGLAEASRENLAGMPWVDMRHGDGAAPFDESFDAILINAGVTHPQSTWLDALAPGARMVMPLTTSMPGMANIGKGLLLHLTRTEGDGIAARLLTFVAIYSAQGLRDDVLNTAIGAALSKQPLPRFSTLRRDAHDPSPDCWLHAAGFCLTTSSAASSALGLGTD
jgi:protein-L-isoaspartate(D-aspartate) O-methyltransferase